MADNLTDTAENFALNWLTQNTTTAPTGALKCRLMMTTNGSDSAAGTEVAGGSYTPQTVTFGAASSGATSNSSDLTFSGMPACPVVGVEIWDSAAGTPIRWWWGALSASKTVNSGDTFVIPASDLDLSLG